MGHGVAQDDLDPEEEGKIRRDLKELKRKEQEEERKKKEEEQERKEREKPPRPTP